MPNLRVCDETQELKRKCLSLYREHHPELDKIPLSDNKIIFEICKYYIKGTHYE